jgi:hypothetical protein
VPIIACSVPPSRQNAYYASRSNRFVSVPASNHKFNILQTDNASELYTSCMSKNIVSVDMYFLRLREEYLPTTPPFRFTDNSYPAHLK